MTSSEISEQQSSSNFTRNTIYSVSDILSADFPDPNWLVQGLLPEGFGFLGGRPKVGKSWLALQLAMAIGTGASFLGRSTTKAGVLYLPYEDNPRRIKERSVMIGMPLDASVDFKIMPKPIDRNNVLILQAAVEQKNYKLVIIDTAARAFQIDHNDAEASLKAIDELQQFCLEKGISLLVVDHHRKNSMFESNPVDDISGSTVKSGVADFIWGLYKHDGQFSLRVIGRDVTEEEIALNFNRENCHWEDTGNSRNEPKPNTKRSIVFEAMQELLNEGKTATTQRIAERLGMKNSLVSRELKQLLNLGLVLKGDKKGVEQPYLLMPDENDIDTA